MRLVPGSQSEVRKHAGCFRGEWLRHCATDVHHQRLHAAPRAAAPAARTYALPRHQAVVCRPVQAPPARPRATPREGLLFAIGAMTLGPAAAARLAVWPGVACVACVRRSATLALRGRDVYLSRSLPSRARRGSDLLQLAQLGGKKEEDCKKFCHENRAKSCVTKYCKNSAQETEIIFF